VASALEVGVVNGPYFLVDGGDVSVYSGVRELEAHLEPYDVEGSALRLFRSDGTELSLETKADRPGTALYKRRVMAAEHVIGRDPSHLATSIRTYLRGPFPKRERYLMATRTMSPEHLKIAELPELVEEFLRVFRV
jgi:hypothetical protein